MVDVSQDTTGKRWKHDKFRSDGVAGGSQPRRNQVTRVQVTNLALGVTNKDINVSLPLFCICFLGGCKGVFPFYISETIRESLVTFTSFW